MNPLEKERKKKKKKTIKCVHSIDKSTSIPFPLIAIATIGDILFANCLAQFLRISPYVHRTHLVTDY